MTRISSESRIPLTAHFGYVLTHRPHVASHPLRHVVIHEGRQRRRDPTVAQCKYVDRGAESVRGEGDQLVLGTLVRPASQHVHDGQTCVDRPSVAGDRHQQGFLISRRAPAGAPRDSRSPSRRSRVRRGRSELACRGLGRRRSRSQFVGIFLTVADSPTVALG